MYIYRRKYNKNKNYYDFKQTNISWYAVKLNLENIKDDLLCRFLKILGQIQFLNTDQMIKHNSF